MKFSNRALRTGWVGLPILLLMLAGAAPASAGDLGFGFSYSRGCSSPSIVYGAGGCYAPVGRRVVINDCGYPPVAGYAYRGGYVGFGSRVYVRGNDRFGGYCGNAPVYIPRRTYIYRNDRCGVDVDVDVWRGHGRRSVGGSFYYRR